MSNKMANFEPTVYTPSIDKWGEIDLTLDDEPKAEQASKNNLFYVVLFIASAILLFVGFIYLIGWIIVSSDAIVDYAYRLWHAGINRIVDSALNIK